MPRIQQFGRVTLALGAVGVLAAGCFGGTAQPAAHGPAHRHEASAPAKQAPAKQTPSPAPSPIASLSPSPSASPPPVTPTPTPQPSPAAAHTSPAAAHTSPVAAHTSPAAVAPSTPGPSPSSTGAPPPRQVQYGGGGVTVRGRADAPKLHGTSRAFRRFLVAAVPQQSDSCPDRGSITVQAWRADGFAVGDVFACGGYRAIWGTNGTASWRQLIGSQDLWSCRDLKRYRVPASIAGDKCAAGGTLRAYHHA